MIRVPMTLNEDEMRLITAYNEMKVRANGNKAQEMMIRVSNGNLTLYDIRPVKIQPKHIDKR